ncbi:MAG: hypothetical protein C5S48_01260 [Candidatus Methanogaster sp.]|nr:MAG: hypothetical protein C5S48_01260 [ANME-2 cluster archaeon]
MRIHYLQHVPFEGPGNVKDRAFKEKAKEAAVS